MTPKELSVVIERYIRPQTFPLSFKFGDDQRARKLKDLTICQIYNMARRYGWFLKFDVETTCPLGIIAYGFAEPDELYKSGKLAYEAGYAVNEEIGKKFEEVVPKIRGYKSCLVAPLEREDFIPKPDFVVVYATPAQVLRFVHAYLYNKGGKVDTSILGRGACAEFLEAFIYKKLKILIPCYGDRLFGLTQDHEMAVAFPFEMAEEIAKGLEETHKRGIRYPIPNTALRVPLPMIESYRKSVESMRKSSES
ncbi:MAG: hypothetical protein DSO01_01185 [Archaeoglobi archaeon]|jgi:uncharacterized protein (DUF169 family)|nr:DUF169 domain-containing protein [Archaeoglobus sp.]NHW88501.1 hypothetical protein [Archaeoglobales archaeon]TDA28183.1 MAG: hypothetical protein DSO01_01185 [Archaeoglobi archaeon]